MTAINAGELGSEGSCCFHSLRIAFLAKPSNLYGKVLKVYGNLMESFLSLKGHIFYWKNYDQLNSL